MQYKQKTDAELVVLLTLNDEEAFSELYVRYKSKLQYFCFHFLYSKMIFFIRLQLSHSFFIISHSSLLYAFKAFIAQMYSKKKKLPTISDKNI